VSGPLGPAAASPRVPVTVTATVVGLVVGSFLNVVIYRVPRRLSVMRPRSFCPVCETPIRPIDNVPVLSWLVLRGRCRVCGDPISIRYPAVELGTAILFGLVAWALGGHWAVAGTCVLGATLLVLVAVALDGNPPPASIALAGTAIGALLLAAAAAADQRWWHLVGMLIGAAVSAGVVGVAAREAPVARAARQGRAGPMPVGPPALPWALLPAGTAIGSLGALASAVGVPVTVAVAFVVAALVRRARLRGGIVGALAITVAAAAGSVAAVIGAVAGGGTIGP
jgi:leader peptidase (prepilin peptidase) / N-methyltransferase